MRRHRASSTGWGGCGRGKATHLHPAAHRGRPHIVGGGPDDQHVAMLETFNDVLTAMVYAAPGWPSSPSSGAGFV